MFCGSQTGSDGRSFDVVLKTGEEGEEACQVEEEGSRQARLRWSVGHYRFADRQQEFLLFLRCRCCRGRRTERTEMGTVRWQSVRSRQTQRQRRTKDCLSDDRI